MIRVITINSFRFVLLVFLQLFILNHIQFSGFVNPYLYILFILLLPFEISGLLILFLGFVLGLTIDIASATIGYHTIATIFMTYLRYHVLRLIAPRDDYTPGMASAMKTLGFRWYFKYVSVLTVAHHLVLFWIESFSIGDLLPATLRALASSVFTILLIIIYQFLAMRSK